MKKFLNVFILLIFSCAFWQCSYDDDDLWLEINNLKSQFATLNDEISTLQILTKALSQNKWITEVEHHSTGYTVTLSDGQTITLKNGNNGADAPIIGIAIYEGAYYWTLGGSNNWLLDNKNNKIPVSGIDGHTPNLQVDAEGYWTIDDVRITNSDGEFVKATGKPGDSFFASIRDNDTEVIFILTNGTEIAIPKSSQSLFSFVRPDNNHSCFIFNFGTKRTLQLNLIDIVSVDIMNIPDGWSAKLDITKKSVMIQAPPISDNSYNSGVITLVGIHKNGNTLFASAELCASIDFTDESGTFVVCEGNMTTVNGMLVFYDRNGKEYKEVFEQANNGLEIGNVVQDLFIANDRIYLITQNGDNKGGAGRFVVCEARTMKMIYADPLIIKTPEGKATWPQHIVVTGDSQAYIQYSEAGMEATSGICALTLKEKSVEVGPTIAGTFGKFTTEGATKTRMVFSRGKVYAGCGHHVIIINPKTNSIEKKITYTGQQVKGITKAADGNIYFALAATFTGNIYAPVFTSKPKIVGMDHEGNILQTTDMPDAVKLPVASWSPAIAMCASFTDPYLYFVDSDNFNATSATRYNYVTKTFDIHYISGSQTIYGIMGQHPKTKKLWVGKSSYVDSNIFVYDVSGTSAIEEKNFSYPTQKGASPAGIDFVYRFTTQYINM